MFALHEFKNDRLIQCRDTALTFAQTKAVPAVKTVATKAWTIASSPEALEIYRSILVWAIVALVVAGIFTWRAVKAIALWAWEYRDRTAVYHWCQDGRSAFVQSRAWAWLQSIVAAVENQLELSKGFCLAIALQILVRLGVENQEI